MKWCYPDIPISAGAGNERHQQKIIRKWLSDGVEWCVCVYFTARVYTACMANKKNDDLCWIFRICRVGDGCHRPLLPIFFFSHAARQLELVELPNCAMFLLLNDIWKMNHFGKLIYFEHQPKVCKRNHPFQVVSIKYQLRKSLQQDIRVYVRYPWYYSEHRFRSWCYLLVANWTPAQCQIKIARQKAGHQLFFFAQAWFALSTRTDEFRFLSHHTRRLTACRYNTSRCNWAHRMCVSIFGVLAYNGLSALFFVCVTQKQFG